MSEAQTAAATQGPPAEAGVPAEPRDAILDRYRLLAAQHLRDSATMAGMMAGILDGSRSGTGEDLVAIERAHGLLTREAGSALMCLGAVAEAAGTA